MTNPYVAFRQLERFFGYKGPDMGINGRSPRNIPYTEGSQRIATIVFSPGTGEEIIERVPTTEPPIKKS
jgi:hypothetical protein